jgi:hypothetical protein
MAKSGSSARAEKFRRKIMDKHAERVLKTFDELQAKGAPAQAAATLALAVQVARLNETWESFSEAAAEHTCSLANTIEKQLREIDKTLMKELR